MKIKTHILLLLVLAVGSFACVKETVKTVIPSEGTVKLRFAVTAPGITKTSLTRAVTEDGLSQVAVLVLEDTGNGYQFNYAVAGYSLQESTGSADYEFLARIVASPNPVRLYLVANAPGSTDLLTKGMNEEQVKQSVTLVYNNLGFTDVLPMTGILDFPGGITQEPAGPLTASLVRSVAKVNVVNTADNFTLTSVKVYRANDLIQLIPNNLTDNAVSQASVPPGASQTVNTSTFPAAGNAATELLYIPESDIPAAADRQLGATAVVVGGIYDNSGVTTYYRMDFVPDNPPGGADLFGQVLRNHLYLFTIGGVLAPGWSTDDEAAVNPSSQIEAEVIVWNNENMYMVFDGINYLGVSRRTVRLGFAAGSMQNVVVDTSLDTYQAYWSDADGTYAESDPSITWGQNFQDSDGLFRAAVSADGTVITFTALQDYDPAAPLPKYLVLVAGRLRLVITVTQGATSLQRKLRIANSTVEIGSFGDSRLGPTQAAINAGERARGVVNMLVGGRNFGPGQPVDIAGVTIFGVPAPLTSMPFTAYDFADVLYLTYAANPVQEDVDAILEWLDTNEDKLLVVQYDNAATNPVMMQALGLTFIAGYGVAPYIYTADQAPAFLRTGPFGTVTQEFNYKCQDTTYGTVSPTQADALGYIPVLLSSYTGAQPSAGNYVMAVNPTRRIVICGDCDIWTNRTDAPNNGYYLQGLTAASPAIDPANPAHVLIANLWAWIASVTLTQE